jgi:hypothetical protein
MRRDEAAVWCAADDVGCAVFDESGVEVKKID